jgi:hypothetical protein
MYDKELLEKLDNNVEYVTFQHVPTMQEITQFKDAIKRAKSGDKLLREDVADFLTNEMQTKLGSAIGAKIYKYVGSFGPVANPIVATMTKDDQLLRSAVRNTNKRKIYEFIKESGLDLIREVQYEKNNHGMMVPKMVDDANWKTVVYMQDGQVKGYLANRSLARSLDTGRMDEVVWLKNVLNAESMIRNMFTQLNPFFNLRNNIKDVERSATYIPGRQRMRLLPGVSWNYFPGAGFLLSLQRYNIPSELAKKVLPSFMLNDKMVEWDLAAGRRATRLIQTNTINEAEKQAIELMRKGDTRTAERLFDDVKLARAGMENGILMSHNEQIREDSNADDFTRRLYKNGIVKEDLVTGLNMAARMLGFAKEAVRKVEGWGETGELTTKLATWKYLERYGDKLGIDKNERIIMTRELGGSPDFSERSFSAAYIETITQSFVNASKEGTVSALTAFKERPGEVSAKLLTNVVMPTIVRHMLGSGLALLISKWWEPDEEKRKASQMHSFIQWYYDRMQFVPSYILKNFHSYPVPVKSLEGSDFTAILRMPMDQTSMALSLLVWNTMDALGENMIDYMNRNNPTAAPTVLSRTQNPIREVLNVFASSLGPDAVGEGQLGGLLGVTLGYFSGSNFHDSFRDKDVFNADELISRFTSGAWKPAAKTFAGELSNRLGGSMVKRYSRDDPFRQELPMLGQWLNDPFIQPSLGAFFNVYTGGQIQMERKLGTIKKEFEAPIKVEARMDFEQALREGGKGSLKITKEMEAKQIAGKTYEERIKSQIYREEFYGLLQKHFKNELKRGEIGELIKLGNEKNPLMQSIRMDIMERSRNRSPMETNSPLMEDGKGL